MSKRRKIGDRVWVIDGAAFNASHGQWATIIDCESNRDDDRFPCILGCGDDNCSEWNDLITDDDRPLYHVCECEMLDVPIANSEAEITLVKITEEVGHE